jgi:hypothetical protein
VWLARFARDKLLSEIGGLGYYRDASMTRPDQG